MEGQLAKLKILAFTKPELTQAGQPVSFYMAMFNPESFSVQHTVNFCIEPAPGNPTSIPKFKNIDSKIYNFDFIIDGTGASGEKREVFADIQLFKYTVGFFGEIHRPFYLILLWGTFIASCVLKSMTIKYELFRPDGTPLRAIISASFLEFTESTLADLKNNKSSPDLTHVRTVKEGDTLPLMAYKIYGDSSYYLEIARVNKLKNFRKLKAGDKIYFPPTDKTTK